MESRKLRSLQARGQVVPAESRSLLSLEESAGRARPLRCWNASERAQVAVGVSEVLRQWSDDWGLRVDAKAAEAKAVPGDASPEGVFEPAEWRPLDATVVGLWGGIPSTVGRARGAETSMADLLLPIWRALFGETPEEAWPGPRAEEAGEIASSSIAADIVRAAWTDWAHRLASAIGAPEVGTGRASEGAPGPWSLSAFSGALRIAIPWLGRDLSLLVSGDRVCRFLGRSTAGEAKRPTAVTGALTPVLDALERRKTRLSAELLTFQLDLGALASLRVGDVLRTSHALDRPLSMNAAEADGGSGRPFCEGFLGKVGMARAVELTAISAAGSAAPKTAAGPAKTESDISGVPRRNGKLPAETQVT
jgi:hypothetical protein